MLILIILLVILDLLERINELKNSCKYSCGSLNIFPNDKIKNEDLLNVFWSNIENPLYGDKIGLFCLTESNVFKLYHMYNCFKNNKSVIRSYGLIKVKIIYPRTKCRLEYIPLGIIKDEVRIKSDLIDFIYDIYDPFYIHIGKTNEKDGMLIMWTSGSNLRPLVHYGIDKKMELVEYGKSTTYNSADMCDYPANASNVIPGFFHTVELKKLMPGKIYYYKVGNEKKMSDIFYFKTDDYFKSKPMSIIVFGDLSTGYIEPYLTIDNIKKHIDSNNPPDILLHIGDISYARGKEYIWEEFMNMIQKVAAYLPYQVSLGNHEHLYFHGQENDPSGEKENFYPLENPNLNSGGECSVPMIHRFGAPDNGNSIFWYRLEYNNVHIFMLCSELNFTKDSRQYNWLVSELESIDRSTNPWIIFTIHRPMYSFQYVKIVPKLASLLRKHIEPLMIKYKVDLFFAGHVHLFERICAINNFNCVNSSYNSDIHGVPQITVGSGGKLDQVSSTDQPYYSKRLLLTYGFGRLDLYNITHASFKFIGHGNKILDEITVTRKYNLKYLKSNLIN